MKTVFEYTNVNASDRLESYVLKKLTKLSNKYPFVMRGDVFFKKENSSNQKSHICGIQLSVPGPRLYASSKEKNFESAISETVYDLNDQLKKRKTKFGR